MRQIRMLLVDDSPVFLKAARDVLSQCPDVRIVAEASSGEAAVSASQRLELDLVLMDLRLPGMSGLEATRRIRRSSGTSIAIVTGETADEYRRAAADAGACDYIEKTDLHEGMERLLGHLNAPVRPEGGVDGRDYAEGCDDQE